jgi:hypothetical protein
MAVGQSINLWLTHRYREQAPSHILTAGCQQVICRP